MNRPVERNGDILGSGPLAFAVAAFVFMQVPAFAGRAGTWIDLATPLFVIAVAALALHGARRRVLAFGVVAAIVYAEGHGIHLSANDVGHYETIAGKAEDVRHFWDERFGHLVWHLGFLGLLAALALADERRERPGRSEWLAAGLLGWTLFAATVEGQDWALALAAAAVAFAWAATRPRRTVVVFAAATLLAAALIGIWAAWHRGIPQFSELGWL